jgi:hypothetical protein
MLFVVVAASLTAVLVGCTEEDPLYCGPNTLCGPGYYCDYPNNTCRPTEAGPGQPDMKKTTDGPVPDQGPPSDGPKAEGPQGDGPKKAKGEACGFEGECASGFCVDGFCCDSACDGACQSCALSGSEGACTPIASGEDPDSDCAGTDPACGGKCDGKGACSYAPTTKSCGAASCAAGQLTSKLCDGSGGCSTSSTSCGGYACDTAGTACLTSCSSTAQCTGSFQCVGSKCVASLPNGSACGTNDKACASGHCVDGVCCDTTCAGTCQSCKLAGKTGTCSSIPSGQDPDKECTGTSAACAGTCNGSAACTYPGATVTCAATTCSSSMLSVHKCDGAGTCKTTTSSCGRFTCNAGGTACLTSCTVDTQCIGGRFCHASKCLSWVPQQIPSTPYDLSGIWGSAANDIWAVGGGGTMLHYNGTAWSKVTSGTTANLGSVWGSGKNDVWAVGNAGIVLHYNGSTWSSSTQGSTDHHRVWGTSASNVWVVGPEGIHHFNGTTWAANTSVGGGALWGSTANDVFLLGSNPGGSFVRHFNGTNWSAETTISTKLMGCLYGFASNDIWTAGETGTVLRYNGSGWNAVTPAFPSTALLAAVWGTGPNDVWVSGDTTSVFHFNGSTWKTTNAPGGAFGLWGTATDDVWSVGGGVLHLE